MYHCYRFTVVAKNSSISPRVVLTTTVTVRVKSVNRHGPEFDVGFYSVDVPEDTAVDTCFLHVSNTEFTFVIITT